MATSSDTGGLIPKFIAELQMPKAISEVNTQATPFHINLMLTMENAICQDVPHFFHWFEKLPKST